MTGEARSSLRRRLDGQGFALAPGVLTHAECDELLSLVVPCSDLGEPRRGGVRGILEKVPELRRRLIAPPLRRLVDEALSAAAIPVRAILFDKTPDANWLVPWHQDRTIAVAERRDTLGYGPWSVKDGAVHVQPPREVLDRMVTLRIHLDDCGEDDGALQVIPGSHSRGPLHERPAGRSVPCPASRGDVLVMRPLVWHASAKATCPTHRRVLHVEHSDATLGGGLRWRVA